MFSLSEGILQLTHSLDEIDGLKEIFQALATKVPEITDLIESLRSYCLHKDTFVEEDYRLLLHRVFENGPNITRLKLNLPFHIVGNSSVTTTRLFANALACAANRPEEHQKIDTLSLDHITDRTVNNLFNVPVDVENAFKVFGNLKNLVISIKRQERRPSSQVAFTRNFWMLMRKAQNLESLCMTGWNVTRTTRNVRVPSRMSFAEWSMKGLPYQPSNGPVLNRLKYLELKRLDLDPLMFLLLIEENRHSLTELYLNEVSLKVIGASDKENTSLWIGHPNVNAPKSKKCTLVAPELRKMEGLNLKILRVKKLGYDDFNLDPRSAYPNYDLDDPSGLRRSFDQRFVEAVLGTKDPQDLYGKAASPKADPITYDTEIYQLSRNTTSMYKKTIDGIFAIHNEKALFELQKIFNVADTGMALINREITRSNALILDHNSGGLISPSTDT